MLVELVMVCQLLGLLSRLAPSIPILIFPYCKAWSTMEAALTILGISARVSSWLIAHGTKW